MLDGLTSWMTVRQGSTLRKMNRRVERHDRWCFSVWHIMTMMMNKLLLNTLCVMKKNCTSVF